MTDTEGLNTTVRAEIAYDSPAGAVHSDLDPMLTKSFADPAYREVLHAALDEWLDHAKGTGGFYIGHHSFVGFVDDFRED